MKEVGRRRKEERKKEKGRRRKEQMKKKRGEVGRGRKKGRMKDVRGKSRIGWVRRTGDELRRSKNEEGWGRKGEEGGGGANEA